MKKRLAVRKPQSHIAMEAVISVICTLCLQERTES